MAVPKALLDTDILSAVMKGNPAVIARARTYLAEHGALAFSLITRYEILRGLKAKKATAQLEAFDRLCETCLILIGTSALVHGLVVVTNNEDHFRRLPGLEVENWLKA